uniref:Uncharacterized protein n=1 Tax=Anguilla anguilla TaxID=7936 RepID=A0A0E9SQU0_ANGAN
MLARNIYQQCLYRKSASGDDFLVSTERRHAETHLRFPEKLLQHHAFTINCGIMRIIHSSPPIPEKKPSNYRY